MLPKQETRNCENKRELRAISDNHILTSTHNEVQLTHISRQQETHRQTKKPVHSYVALAKNIRPRIGDVNSVSVEHMDVNLSHTSVIRSMYDRFTRCMGEWEVAKDQGSFGLLSSQRRIYLQLKGTVDQ